MAEKIEFQQIEGMLSLDDATKELVHLAQCIQRTHNSTSSQRSKLESLQLYESRKAGINAVMDLIGQYIKQIPDDNQNADTCGVCNDILECLNGKHQCGNPMVYLNHGDNIQKVTLNMPACGFFSREKGK